MTGRGAESPVLMMAIPKKLVPSAPVRNLVRRVIRESYRHCPRTEGAGLERLSVLVKLTQVPQKALPPGAESGDPRPKPRAGAAARVRPFDRRPPDRALKRALRAEADALFAQLAAAVAQGATAARAVKAGAGSCRPC